MYIALIAVFIPAFILAQPTEERGCPRACGYSYFPVCGSNGETYDNQCAFETARDCNGLADLTLANTGRCEPKPDCFTAVEVGNCRAFIQKWHFDMSTYKCTSFVYGGCDTGFSKNRYDSKEECERKCAVPCPERCPNTYAPICGTNGKTHSNLCQMKRANCRDNTAVTMAYEGECTNSECPRVCPFNYEPVCGSNGVTYSNTCLFEKARDCDGLNELNIGNSGECPE